MSQDNSLENVFERGPDSGPGFRLAVPQDNQRILDLFGSTPMEGNLILATRREPDFFSLYDIQQAETQCIINDGENQAEAVSAFIVRDGWVNGESTKVGYLGDLRTSGSGRRALTVVRSYAKLFDVVSKRNDCRLFLTSIMASNTMAIRALVERRGKKRQDQPYYHLVKEFSTIALHFTFPIRKTKSAFQVRTAREEDIPGIRELLSEDHKNRLMGYAYDKGEFEHRLENWPDYTLDKTYIATDSTGRIVGCTTAWDAQAVKRYQVMKYSGDMIWVKRFFNAGASVFGFPKLPAAGDVFRYFYLANISVQGEDPVIFRALLERIYSDHRKAGYHFMTFPIDKDDPLEPALKGFMTRGIDFNLYAVSSAQEPVRDFQVGRTGFEIALA